MNARLGVRLGLAAVSIGLTFAVTLAVTPAAQARVLPLPVYYRVDTKDDVVFLTVDDGIVQTKGALAYVLKHHLPITSFLTSSQVPHRAQYFKQISQWGSIQNHTTTHQDFNDPSTNFDRQICPVQKYYTKQFGTEPWMLRPPYGNGARNQYMQSVANGCGINRILLWDAVVDKGRLTTWNNGLLNRGSIILMHYTSNLEYDLRVAVSAARAQGLHPANLSDYLLPPKDRRPDPSQDDTTSVPG